MAAISVKSEIAKGIKEGLGHEDIIVNLLRRGAISKADAGNLKKYILTAAANALKKQKKQAA